MACSEVIGVPSFQGLTYEHKCQRLAELDDTQHEQRDGYYAKRHAGRNHEQRHVGKPKLLHWLLQCREWKQREKVAQL